MRVIYQDWYCTLCLLLSNGISLVFPRLADPISGIWLFSGQSTARTEGGWLQCRARQVMLDQSTTIKFILVPIEWKYWEGYWYIKWPTLKYSQRLGFQSHRTVLVAVTVKRTPNVYRNKTRDCGLGRPERDWAERCLEGWVQKRGRVSVRLSEQKYTCSM
jgi:hypothetical protein